MSDDELWSRALEIAELISHLSRDEREGSLGKHCGSNRELRSKVEILLREPTGLDRDESRLESEPSQTVPSKEFLGPYQVLKLLGKGGMGEVYLAVLADDPLRRIDAVKVLPSDRMTLDRLTSAIREGEIFKTIQGEYFPEYRGHGKLPDGRPYLAMQFIDGVPIDEYCRAKNLSLNERLLLFRKICAAVSIAHQSLFLHRDLKPSNILVTADGTPKVLDFGIAKALNLDGTAGRTLTIASEQHLTLDYASPEQITSSVLTTAADVYSLGVLLYQLLTDRLPLELSSLYPSWDQIVAAVQNQEPPRPSSGAGTKQRNHTTGIPRQTIRGDLDTIVLKALRKEPHQRYASVEQLSEDIGRFLEKRPILAEKPTLGYRTRKLVQRNWRLLGVAGTIFSITIAFATFATIQQRQTATERDRAQQSLSLLEDLFQQSDPSEAQGKDVTAREFLGKAAVKLQEDKTTGPLIRAELLNTIGSVFISLSLPKEALPLKEQALALVEAELGSNDPESAAMLHNVAHAYQELGEYKTAKEFYLRSLASFRKSTHEDSPRVAQVESNLGALEMALGDYDSAEKLLRGALSKNQKAFSDRSPEVLETQQNLASLLMRIGRFIDAEQMFRSLLASNLEIHGRWHPDVATSLHNIGWALARQDRNGEAIDFFQESLQVKEKIYEPTHRSVAASLTNLSSLLHDESRGEEAEAAARRAVEIFTESIGLQHQHTAHALHNHAKALSLLARHEEATNVAKQVISIRREVLPPNHPELAYGISLLAEIMEDLNTDLEEVERLHRESLEIRKGAWETEHISIASGYEKLGLFLSRQGRFKESEPLIQESLRINRINYDKDSLSVAVSESFVAGHMCRKADTLDAGEELARTSLRKLMRILPDTHYRIGEVNLVMGHCLLEQEELEAAEPFLEKAVDTLRDVHGEEGNRTLAAKAMLKRLNEVREDSRRDGASS